MLYSFQLNYLTPPVSQNFKRNDLKRRGLKNIKTTEPSISLSHSRQHISVPDHPSEVSLSKRQLLQKVIPKRRPLVPEAVVLGPQVQDLQQALPLVPEVGAGLALDVRPEHEPQINIGRDESPSLRRSARLDYNRLHRTGAKERKN